MFSENIKPNNDLANGKANGEQICDETSAAKPHTAVSEDPEAKSEAAATAEPAQVAGEEVVEEGDTLALEEKQEQDERVLPEIDDPNNDR